MGNSRSVGPQIKHLPEDSKPNGARRNTQNRISVKKPFINTAQRQIVRGCIDKAKDDLAGRIYRRVYDKRDDFRIFVCSLPNEMMVELSISLKEFLLYSVDSLTDGDEVRRVAEDFGSKHVKYRVYGFRPDFFVAIADAVTMECVLLDGAVHQASETLSAWSAFTSQAFSSVRDGYYNEQRRMRRVSNSSAFTSKDSKDSLNSSFEDSQGNFKRKTNGSYRDSRTVPGSSERQTEIRSSLPNFSTYLSTHLSFSNSLRGKICKNDSGDDISRSDLTFDELSDSMVEVKHRYPSDDILISIEDSSTDVCVENNVTSTIQ